MEPSSFYYDSDDDVCWGPYTLREMKRDLRQIKCREDIQSRSSLCCDPCFVNGVEKRGLSLVTIDEQLSDLQSCSSSSPILVTETRDSTEKVNDSQENSRLSVINTTHVSTNSENAIATDISTNNSSCESISENVSNENEMSFNDTLAEMEKLLNGRSNFSLKEEQQNENIFKSALFIPTSSIDKEISGLQSSSPILNIEFSDFTEKINDGEENSRFSIISTTDVSTNRTDAIATDFSANNSSCESISENVSNENEISFSDTLAEMEKLLNERPNFLPKEEQKSENIFKSDLVSPVLYVQNTLANSIPVRINNNTGKLKFDYIISPVAAYIKSSPKLPKTFKVPEKPAKTKVISPNQTSTKHRFKNINSPVATYIKNAPTVPLYKVVTPKKVSRETRQENVVSLTKEANKENTDVDFPEVIYRPATHTITSDHKTFKLPSNIKMLMPNEAAVVNHVKRIGTHKKESISRRLLEDNLTIDDSQLDRSTQDISVHITKRALI